MGAEKYTRYLDRMGYGQLARKFDVTKFWLDGSLTISAYEQVEFLRGLRQRKLPCSRHAYDTLAGIMIADAGPGYTLRAKTGWSGGKAPQVGWYVGYVETVADVWFFATNIVVRDGGDLPERLAITREALAAKGIPPR